MVLSVRASLPVSFVLLGLLPAAQSVRLSAPLERQRAGTVFKNELTADGASLVFISDRDAVARYELYSVAADGSGTPVRLNDTIPTDKFIQFWALGAGDRVVYLVGSSGASGGELFSVPADGSAPPISISPPGITYNFLVTRDDVRALVYVSPGPFDMSTVHVVPIDGGPTVELPGTLGYALHGFSPDGTRVLLREYDTDPEFQSVFSCPADGSAAPILLARHDKTPPFVQVYLTVQAFSADGQRLLYSIQDYLPSYTAEDWQWAQYSVPIDGSTPTQRLSAAPSPTYSNVAFDAGIPGGRIAFADGDDLVSMHPDGSARTILTRPGVAVERELVVDGAELYFIGELDSGKRTILRVPLDGSSNALALVPPGQGTVSKLALAGSDALVCLVNHGPLSLVRIPRAGGIPMVLASGPSGRGVRKYELAGNGVLFTTDTDTLDQIELAFVPLDGSSAPIELSETLPPDRDVGEFRAHPDGTTALFKANPEAFGLNQLYRVPLDGSSAPLALTTPVFTNQFIGSVLEFAVTPDRARAVYRTDAGGGQRAELLVARIAQPGVALELSGADAVGPGLVPTLDSTRVLYRTEQGALRIVPLDASATPLTLDATPGTLAPVLTTDGQSALYDAGFALRKIALDGSGAALVLVEPPVGTTRSPARAITLDRKNVNAFYLLEFQLSFSGPFRRNLYQVPLDGSAPAKLLHPELTSTGGVWEYRVTPDGRHVVYSASHIEDSSLELYVVALEGDRTPRRLNPSAHRLTTFGAFELSADGRQVVLRAEQILFGSYGLFGVPVDGKLRSAGAPPSDAGRAFVALTHLRSDRGVEEEFLLAGDAVVYRADAEVTDRIEIFRSPLDSGRGRTRLSGTMTPGGDASALTLSDDGQWVVYVADQFTDTLNELFAVPTAGGFTQSLLPLPSYARIDGWYAEGITGLVHFRADVLTNEQYELFNVPLDASGPVELRNSTLVPGGDVEADFFPLGDGRLIFRADGAQDGHSELQLSL